MAWLGATIDYHFSWPQMDVPFPPKSFFVSFWKSATSINKIVFKNNIFHFKRILATKRLQVRFGVCVCVCVCVHTHTHTHLHDVPRADVVHVLLMPSADIWPRADTLDVHSRFYPHIRTRHPSKPQNPPEKYGVSLRPLSAFKLWPTHKKCIKLCLMTRRYTICQVCTKNRLIFACSHWLKSGH